MYTGISITHLYVFLILHNLMQPNCCSAVDSITQSKKLFVGETLKSPGQFFELGFFRPGNSRKTFVGIWFKKIQVQKVIWVANRNSPLQGSDSAASLEVNGDGNLVILNGNQTIFWTTNISANISHNSSSSAILQDNGNLELKDEASGKLLWESFLSPCDTVVPGMKIGLNVKTGEKRFLSSWKEEDDDPSPGKFVMGLSLEETFIWNNSIPYWRSGEWNGLKHIGVPILDVSQLIGFNVISDDQQGTTYYVYSSVNDSVVRHVTLTSSGLLTTMEWDEGKRNWFSIWSSIQNHCDPYNVCGPFGVCDAKGSPICRCLRGYVPKSYQEWKRGNWTGGCVRRTEFACDRKMNKNGTSNAKIQGNEDGFLKISRMKLPEHSDHMQFDLSRSCGEWCLNNCSCIAYAYVEGIRCMVWGRELIDMQIFENGGEDLFLRLPKSELGDNKRRTKLILIGLFLPAGIFILGLVIYAITKHKNNQNGRTRRKRRKRLESAFPFTTYREVMDNTLKQDSSELPMFDFSEIQTATKNFCFSNKLGEGGFGPVYKGKLQNGQEIAVKRLSNHSGQGLEEFKNEIILVSKLQHRNLVRLLGCCIDQEELIIIYEYMFNKSLDKFLFDATKRALLDWPKRFNIIQGIARGLLYLHRDSCLRIIHRDLKVSNILLDESLNPKISDFGLARIFQGTQELARTGRVIGTFGYMSPEYVLRGTFSEKSDVFSFGVLLLEIISGKKTASFYDQEESLNLLDDAWQLWSDNRELEFMDQTLVDSYSEKEVVRCLEVGLLCVQNRAMDRPTMSTVVQMLTGETNHQQPKQPPCISRRCSNDRVHAVQTQSSSITISILHGR